MALGDGLAVVPVAIPADGAGSADGVGAGDGDGELLGTGWTFASSGTIGGALLDEEQARRVVNPSAQVVFTLEV